MQRNRRSRHSNPDHGIEVKDEAFLYALIRSTKNPLILVLDQIQDPHNLGACLRTADAAGVHAVVIPKDNSAPLSETVVHVASGAAETIPLVSVTNLARTLREIQQLGVWLTGTADEATQTMYDVDYTSGTGIVMGAEGEGLRRLTREVCDNLISIPMAGKIPCLNVSVATGVCLYEVVRQRNLAQNQKP